VIDMRDQVRTNEGITAFGTSDATVHDLTARIASVDPSDTAPRRVYSLDGLLALALAVHTLEETA
jgi:hypothetical protein